MKMRIIIAEDELVERKAMRKFIEETFVDMEVVGEAMNGRKAVELAEQLEPDIMFMDIRMPGVNGLEAIEQISVKHKRIKFILVSAYDSFEYAKEAMRFGIKDYILKPGRRQEIVKTLLRVSKEIHQEQQSDLQSQVLRKEQLLDRLMHQSDSRGIKELKGQLFPDMETACFFVIKATGDHNLEDYEYQLKTVLSSKACIFKSIPSEQVIVGCIFSVNKLIKSDLLVLARKVHLELGEASYIGIGNPTANMDQLAHSYQNAYRACIDLFADRNRNYGFYQGKIKDKQTDEKINTICILVEQGKQEEVIVFFKNHESELTGMDKEELYIQLIQLFARHGVEKPKTLVTSLQSSQDWYSYLHLCCMQMRDYFASKRSIHLAKTFMNEHFHENLTLEQVAAEVNLSPNYFSNLFRAGVGSTFIDYLTQIRLQKAKELIETNNYSLKEISFMIGYKDPNYFSRVFKKHVNQSPKQYQQAILRK